MIKTTTTNTTIVTITPTLELLSSDEAKCVGECMNVGRITVGTAIIIIVVVVVVVVVVVAAAATATVVVVVVVVDAVSVSVAVVAVMSMVLVVVAVIVVMVIDIANIVIYSYMVHGHWGLNNAGCLHKVAINRYL